LVQSQICCEWQTYSKKGSRDDGYGLWKCLCCFCSFGSNDAQTLKAIAEAEAYDGPSIIIAYSHCIAHGIDMEHPLSVQKALVDSGQWVLYRYNQNNKLVGKNPFNS
jgi:hypothetical protein